MLLDNTKDGKLMSQWEEPYFLFEIASSSFQDSFLWVSSPLLNILFLFFYCFHYICGVAKKIYIYKKILNKMFKTCGWSL